MNKEDLNEVVQQLIDVRGKCIDFAAMKYNPLTEAMQKQIEALEAEIRKLDEWALQRFLKETNKEVSMKIDNYQEINKGCLVAKFNININEWGLTLRECALFVKDGKKWITMPSRQYKDAEGKTKNFPLVEFDKEKRVRFEAKCLELISQLPPPAAPVSSGEEQQQLPFLGDIVNG